MEISSGIVFIASHIDVDGELPIELIANHTFRRARDAEITQINQLLDKSVPPEARDRWVRYDSIVVEIHYGGKTEYRFEKLEKEKWKYWVIAFEGTNAKIHNLQYFFLLLRPDIEFGQTLYFDKPNQEGVFSGFSMLPLHMVEKYTSFDMTCSNAKSIPTTEIIKVIEYDNLFNELESDYEFIKHALVDLYLIRLVPWYSSMISVGCFAIIELLITHSPRQAETLDSIGHQIRTKMALLRKRFNRSIDCSSYFHEANEDTAWKKLYKYRSCLAHGSKIDFKSEFHILKDRKTVLSFLMANLRELIILGLREPQLLVDLKKC